MTREGERGYCYYCGKRRILWGEPGWSSLSCGPCHDERWVPEIWRQGIFRTHAREKDRLTAQIQAGTLRQRPKGAIQTREKEMFDPEESHIPDENDIAEYEAYILPEVMDDGE